MGASVAYKAAVSALPSSWTIADGDSLGNPLIGGIQANDVVVVMVVNHDWSDKIFTDASGMGATWTLGTVGTAGTDRYSAYAVGVNPTPAASGTFNITQNGGGTGASIFVIRGLNNFTPAGIVAQQVWSDSADTLAGSDIIAGDGQAVISHAHMTGGTKSLAASALPSPSAWSSVTQGDEIAGIATPTESVLHRGVWSTTSGFFRRVVTTLKIGRPTSDGTYTDEVLAREPYLWWKYETGVESSQAPDSSGNNRSGSITTVGGGYGSSMVPAVPSEKSLTLNGQPCVRYTSLGVTSGPCAAITRFRATNFANNPAIMAHDRDGDQQYHRWRLYIDATTKKPSVVYRPASAPSTYLVITSTGPALLENTDYMLGFDYDGNTTVRFYVNGVQYGDPVTVQPFQGPASANTIEFGGLWGANGSGLLTGVIDESMYFTKSLSSEDHLALYTAGNGVPPSVVPNLYLGSIKIDKLILGSTDITKAYLGATEF